MSKWTFCKGMSKKHTTTDIVWLARPSHLIAGAVRDGLAAITISSHLFSTNQMLLAGISAIVFIVCGSSVNA